MMTGRLYIDDYDAYSEWGVYVVNGGWNDLISYPPLKNVDSNDWQEYDGIDADLSNPVLNTHDVQIKFAIAGLYSQFYEMIEILSDSSYHEFRIEEIGRTYNLRLVSHSNLTVHRGLCTATLKFADDFPLDGYAYVAPSSSVVESVDYLLDGNSFTDYGVRILQGTMAELLKLPNVKTNLLRNIVTQEGVIYDPENVTYKNKDIKLQCLMRADSLSELWQNYDALLYDLTRANARVLYCDELDEEFSCFYKSQSVSQFFSTDKIWLQFVLTMTLTLMPRIDDSEFLLATEDGSIVMCENNLDAINMYN
jgi:hypothetical protein